MSVWVREEVQKMSRCLITKINKSIKIWTIAFLSVDLVFWILQGVDCLTDSISCQENIMFGGYFFYLPFTLIPLAIPVFLWVVVHSLLGALIGWLLRHHPVRWWLAGLIAFVLLIAASYVFGCWQLQEELERQTKIQLWLVSDASRDQLKFQIGQKLSSDNYAFEDGPVTINLKAYDTSDTQVQLLRCDVAMNCTHETVSFSDYIAAKTSCHQDKLTCPYQGLQKYPILFEVTSNPKAIAQMSQMLY